MQKWALCVITCGVVTGTLCSIPSKASSFETFIRYDLKTGETTEIMLPKDSHDSVLREESKGAEETESEIPIPEEVVALLTEKMNEGDQGETDGERSEGEDSEDYEQLGILRCIGLEESTGNIVGRFGSGIWKKGDCLLTEAHTVYREEEEQPWRLIQFSMEETRRAWTDYDYAVLEMESVQWLPDAETEN